MTHKRDLVYWNPNQRADLGDMNAVSRNQQFDLRRSVENVLFDRNSSERLRIFEGFRVTAQGGPTSQVDIAYGMAVGGEVLADTTIERGVMFGGDTVTSRSVDFTGLPNATYSVWLRFSADLGEAGIRVLYNGDSDTEDADSVYTRVVADWDVEISSASPGDEYMELAEVVWAGATVASGDITEKRNMFFEGDAATTYAAEWGGGANDRNVDRARYGVTSIWSWVHAVRKQLGSIIGGTETWFSLPLVSLYDTYQTFRGNIAATAIDLGTLVNPESMLLQETDTSGEGVPVAIIWSPIDIQNTMGLQPFMTGAYTAGLTIVENYDTDKVGCKLYDSAAAATTFTTYLPVDVEGAFTTAGLDAKFTGFEVWGFRTGTAAATRANVEIKLVRHDPQTGAVSVLATLLAFATWTDTAGAFNTTSALNLAVDTTLYNYYLRFAWQTSSDAAKHIALYGVQLNYRRTKLFRFAGDDAT